MPICVVISKKLSGYRARMRLRSPRGTLILCLAYIEASSLASARSAPRSRAAGARTAISSTSNATANSALSRGIIWARKPIKGAPSKKPP